MTFKLLRKTKLYVINRLGSVAFLWGVICTTILFFKGIIAEEKLSILTSTLLRDATIEQFADSYLVLTILLGVFICVNVVHLFAKNIHLSDQDTLRLNKIVNNLYDEVSSVLTHYSCISFVIFVMRYGFDKNESIYDLVSPICATGIAVLFFKSED